MISEGKVAPCSLGRKQLLATGDVPGQQRALLGCDNGRNWREELQGNSRGTVRQREGSRLGFGAEAGREKEQGKQGARRRGSPRNVWRRSWALQEEGGKVRERLLIFFYLFFFPSHIWCKQGHSEVLKNEC